MTTTDAGSRKPKPPGYCVRCRAVYTTFGIRCINRMPGGASCDGMVRSAQNASECRQCAATGQVLDAICDQCGGVGWFLP